MKSYTKIALFASLALAAVAAVACAVDPTIYAVVTAFLTDPHAQAGILAAEGAAVIDPEMIKAELKKISDQVKEAGDRALAEAKKHGDMSAEMKPKVDELLIKQGELQARLTEVEQQSVRQREQATHAHRSVGAQLVNSPEYKAWHEAGGMRSVQSGFLYTIKAAITSTDTTDTRTVGVPTDEQSLVPLPMRALRVRDLLMPGRTSSNAISYVQQTGFTNHAAVVSEAPTRKPESTLTYEWVQSPVATIAHFIKASKQILDDFQQLQSNIDGQLRYGLKLAEESQLLLGSGSGNNLSGIYTLATSYSAPISVPSPTKIDTLRLMLLQAEIALFPSDGIVLNPADWAAIELTKDDNGGYIFANPQALARPALWGRPVVTTQSMTQDTALVGAFGMAAQIFDREEMNVVIATQNEDDFVRNMITIRCEERLALAVYRPEAFIKNTNLPST